ncbi:hypothetical protein AVEN_144066-1 [Araneus ventricosus]|uniref:Uncharacterized protein n=1 Tax=Araneus ventricosus TaxID=182803 RepID=A0A4Y2DI79_ARAVE|nr:hypothetical protein AVEN_144066-1 [Araneus ventricosus]
MAWPAWAWPGSMTLTTCDKFGDFGDKSKIPENAIIFSIPLLGEEICRMYWIIPLDVTTNRVRVYKWSRLNGGLTLEFRLQCELQSW